MTTQDLNAGQSFDGEEVLELRAILGVLRRQYRIFAYTIVVALAAAVLFLSLANKQYSATALLEVQPKGQDVLQLVRDRSPQTVDENARIESEVEILRSDAIALAVIDDLGLVADPQFQPSLSFPARVASFVGRANASGPRANAHLFALEQFRGRTDVRRKGLTYLISVSATSHDPEQARDLANRMAQMHITQQVTAKIDATLVARDMLDDQMKLARTRLAEREAELDHFLFNRLPEFVQYGAVDGGMAASFQSAQGRIETLGSVATEARTALDRGEWDKAALLLDDPELASLAAQKLSDDASFPLLLDELDDRLQSKAVSRLDDIDQQVHVLKQDALAIKVGLRDALDVSELPSALVAELYAIRQDAGIARNQYDLLLGQLREFEAEAGLQLASTRIVSPAVLPVRPSFPDPGMVLLFALGASMGLGAALAFLNEYFVGGISSETQLSSMLHMPSAASIPFADETSGGRYSPADRVIDTPLTGYSEAFRNLRAAIDLGLRRGSIADQAAGKGQVIAITSAHSGEGKSTAALALARTYAIAGKKTLLIDGDLRRPSIHEQLGVAPAFGFGQYLRTPNDDQSPRDFYARDPASPLALILGAERAFESTDELLNSDTFATMLEQARAVYDVTIIDTPPVLPVVDARYIVPFADAVVLAVRWAATSSGDVKAATMPIRAAMREGALFLPVLTQCHARPGAGAYDVYQSAYSAAT